MLIEKRVNPRLILCIKNFLSGRIQSVRAGSHRSRPIITNVGAPQGCVLSPVLFSLYTSDCTSKTSSCSILKYADDTVITGYLCNDPDEYLSQVNEFVDWCDDHFLLLNTKKTKEMVIDFRKGNTLHQPLRIHGDVIEQVHEYKYLGTVIDDKLSWKDNCLSIQKKTNQRMFFLRKLKKFHIDRTILTLFYQSIIQSVISYNFICTFGNMSNEQKGKLDRTRKIAQRVVGSELLPIQSLYNERILAKVKKIMTDLTHPLHSCYVFNRSGIRLCPPRTRLARFRQSFVPNSIHNFNARVSR